MNYLAHAFLSYQDPGLLVGNMIGDFVKGKQYLHYPEAIQKGILLHRNIDSFTDTHPLILQTKDIYKEAVGLYSGAFLDISLDYFLANDTSIASEAEWKKMVTHTYAAIHSHMAQLPPHFWKMFGYMEKEDWLFNYRYSWRINASFRGLAHRAKYLPDDVNVFPLFEKDCSYLEQSYQSFFPEIQDFVRQWIREH